MLFLLGYILGIISGGLNFILGLMIGSVYPIVLGPTTLENAQPAMTFETFSILFFVLGGAVIIGLQVLKAVLEKKEVKETAEKIENKVKEEVKEVVADVKEEIEEAKAEIKEEVKEIKEKVSKKSKKAKANKDYLEFDICTYLQ